MSYLSRLLPVLIGFTVPHAGPAVMLRPVDMTTDTVMGDTEDPTAFATTYTGDLGWEDTGVLIRGRAWGEFEHVGPSETATIGLEFCGTTIYVSNELMPDELDYWRLDFEIVYYSISGSSDGAYLASGTIHYGASAARGFAYEFYVEPTSIPSGGDVTVRVIADWMDGASDTNELRLYSLIATSND